MRGGRRKESVTSIKTEHKVMRKTSDKVAGRKGPHARPIEKRTEGGDGGKRHARRIKKRAKAQIDPTLSRPTDPQHKDKAGCLPGTVMRPTGICGEDLAMRLVRAARSIGPSRQPLFPRLTPSNKKKKAKKRPRTCGHTGGSPSCRCSEQGPLVAGNLEAAPAKDRYRTSQEGVAPCRKRFRL